MVLTDLGGLIRALCTEERGVFEGELATIGAIGQKSPESTQTGLWSRQAV